jgi:hypothetical protein
LDDSPIPIRAFEKAVRKRSRRVARSLKGCSEAEGADTARAALTEYRALALEFGDEHYATRFNKTLGLSA